ncbi:MAG: thioredoxin [Lachnospiraceae bacterium]|nr:thioredoxin [Lachnospiraceae bacterium]
MLEVMVSKNNFENEVLNEKGIVLVDFFANWCGPCKMLSPVLSQVAEEYKDEVKVCKINIDEEIELAQQYQIASIPALLVFKDGKVVNQSVGFVPKKAIEKLWK